MRRMAVISDVHGNSFALETVKKDIKQREVDAVINAGDSVYGPLNPADTADILMEMNCISICGNQDRLIWAPHETVQKSDTYRYVVDNLTNEHKRWLRSLPKNTTLFDAIFVCHGTPTSDETYLLEKVTSSGVTLNDEDDIAGNLSDYNFPIVICGHSHIPRVVRNEQTGTVIINPGSVGLPAYDDEVPYPHKMETGSPHVRYAILMNDNASWSVEQIVLEYDWEKAAALAEKNGRLDWAKALLTGRM